MFERLILTINLVVALWIPAWAQAQSGSYPARAVKFIVPITPGGSNDVLARTIAHKWTETWGQPVVLENRPGAG